MPLLTTVNRNFSLINYTVTFKDKSDQGWVRVGCIKNYRMPFFEIQLLTGEIVTALSHEFTIDRCQTLINYPDAYGREQPVVDATYETPEVSTREENQTRKETRTPTELVETLNVALETINSVKAFLKTRK